jgi:hypothetical protein
MNEEIQKVDKLKRQSQCGWFAHTSALIPCHITLTQVMIYDQTKGRIWGLKSVWVDDH